MRKGMFWSSIESVVWGYEAGILTTIGLFVEDINASNDPAKALSDFLGVLGFFATNAQNGVSYSDSDLLPGVTIIFSEDGADLRVLVGRSEREYGLGATVQPVVRRLVAIEGDWNAEWYSSKNLYRLLKEGE